MALGKEKKQEFEEEALLHTLWRTYSGTGYGLVTKQTTK